VADLSQSPTAGPQAEPETEVAARPKGPDLLDRTWDFFASVPVATVMIFCVAAISIAGTLIEQEGQYNSWMPPAQYYPDRYGPVLGPLLMKLGLTHAYTSWWYLALLGGAVTSLVVCSLQRGVPLWNAIMKPPIAPVTGFLKHLKFRLTYAAPEGDGLQPAAEALRKLGYKVKIENGRMLAEKGRLNRWGPYILHLGLVIVALGAFTRAIPGWYSDTTIWVRDGETARVPGSTWFVRNDKFTADFYADGRPKNYSTDAVVIENGKEVKRQTVKLNYPLAYKGIELYQSSYQQSLGTVDVVLNQKQGDKSTEVGRFTMDLIQPAKEYQVGNVTPQVVNYFPDFSIGDDGQPGTRSADPNNPAVQFKVTGYDKPIWFLMNYPDMHVDPNAPYTFSVAGMTTRNTTGLRVKKDVGQPILWAGLVVITLGCGITFYFAHRRIWAMVEGGRVLIAGQTNRDRMSFVREFKKLGEKLPGTEFESLGG